MNGLGITHSAAGRGGIRWNKRPGEAHVDVVEIAAVVGKFAPIVSLGITTIRPLIEICAVGLHLLPHNPALSNYSAVFERYDMATYL